MPIEFDHTPGLGNSAVYALFSDGATAVPMLEGASLLQGHYTTADAVIDTAGLGSGTFSARILLGDYTTPSVSDTQVGSVERFVFDGTNEVDQLGDILTDTAAIPSASAIADAVLDETAGDHVGDPNSVGYAIAAAAANATTTVSRLTAARAGYLDNLSAGAVATASALTSLAGKFTGITSVASWLGALFGKTADASTLTEIQATTAGASYNNTTDSLESQQELLTTTAADASTAASGAGGTSAPFLNRVPNATVKVSSRADGYLTSNRVRVMAGETYVVALEYPNPTNWLYGMTLPVSPDVLELTVDSNAYGVNRNLAMVEVTIASGLAAGTEITLPVTVNPTQGTTDIRKILFEVIDPTQ